MAGSVGNVDKCSNPFIHMASVKGNASPPDAKIKINKLHIATRDSCLLLSRLPDLSSFVQPRHRRSSTAAKEVLVSVTRASLPPVPWSHLECSNRMFSSPM